LYSYEVQLRQQGKLLAAASILIRAAFAGYRHAVGQRMPGDGRSEGRLRALPVGDLLKQLGLRPLPTSSADL
jgi:hypothetical protein